ncbi:hypothetical protein N7540_011663 [Penicillium herquei]|nr:hypothetical protein N7540_011663 [Penicillium herquei]
MFKLACKESSPKSADQTRSVILRRQQLLHDPHMNEYHTWSYEKVDGVMSEANRAGLGDFESAKRAFEKLFKDSTGHTWDDRHNKSNPCKFTFVECHFRDEELSLQKLNPDTATSKVNEVIDLVTGQSGGSKKLVEKLVPSKGTIQTEHPLTLSKHQLRVCLAILKQLLVHSDFTKEKATRGKTGIVTTLIECYQALANSPKLSTSVDLEWIRDEYEHLSYHRIITLAPRQELTCPGWASTHLAQHVHRACGLRTMRLVDPSTTEHELLSNYFCFSTRTPPYPGYTGQNRQSPYKLGNIFRIERQQEVKRYQKWIQNHDGRRRLLWHGSPNRYFTGIFSQGLRGGLGQREIYASELAGISTAYSQKLQDGGTSFLMLLCEVSIAKSADTSKAKYRDAKCIHPDLEGVQMLDIAIGENHNLNSPKMSIPHEHRMPAADQVRMRYLFHFKIQV